MIKDVVVNGRKISIRQGHYPVLSDRTRRQNNPASGGEKGGLRFHHDPSLTAKVETRNAYIEEISLGERGYPS